MLIDLCSCICQVSALGYGAWVGRGSYQSPADIANAKEIMKLCVSRGINFFDNAEAYDDGIAERVMGDAIRVGA